MRQIILDTETTGLRTEDGDRIIEIGCIELVDRKFTGNNFHEYINPHKIIHDEAFKVHGISNEFLQDKPSFKDVYKKFYDYINGAELIIHNAAFDVGFIDYEFKLLQKKIKPVADICKITDTLLMARQLHVGQRNSLDALCKRYGVDGSKRDLHGALLDADLLAKVYLAMTGGQGSFFDEAESEEVAHVEQTKDKLSFNYSSKPLKVLRASSEELNSHDEILNMLAKDSECLWKVD